MPVCGSKPVSDVRVAYAVLAHERPDLVARLVRHLVETGGVASIHYDQKAGEEPVEKLKQSLAPYANRLIWPKSIDVKWGEWSLVEATMSAVSAIFEAGHEPDHVQLLSGSDYPIRPLSDFAAFLARHRHTSFIESLSIEEGSWVVGGLSWERFEHRHYFNFKSHRKLFDWNWKIQRRLGMKRRLPEGLQIHFGSQWCTLTNEAWRMVIKAAQQKEIYEAFRWSWIPDEMFFQSLLASDGSNHVERNLVLYQFSKRGVPTVFQNGNVEYLARQPFFFARKIAPDAGKLRDQLDEIISGKVPAVSFEDAQIGVRTTEYKEFVERQTRSLRGRRIPGLVRDEALGDLEWNVESYVCVIAVSPEALDVFRRQIDGLSGVAVHGRLFASEEIEFAGAADRFAGYATKDTALRDHKRSNFLSDVVRFSKPDICVFTMCPNDMDGIADIMVRDGNCRILLIRGNTAEAASTDDEGAGLDQQRQRAERSQAKLSRFHRNWEERAGRTRAKLREIDVGRPQWRTELREFLDSTFPSLPRPDFILASKNQDDGKNSSRKETPRRGVSGAGRKG